MDIRSKIPPLGPSIFSTVSQLAKKHKAINLGQGYPDFDCDEKLKGFISEALYEGKNQYCPMPGTIELREAISNKIANTYEVDLDPETEVCVTAGATQALFTAIAAFVHPGDEVIIIEPAYDSYKPAIHAAGGMPICYDLLSPDYKIDWEVFKTLVTTKTRMIIINTPHNPTGSILESADLETLETLVTDKNIIVLSDEVYEHLIYDGQKHESILIYPNLYKQSLAVYSFGKTLHSTGWKLGYAVGPKRLMDEFKNIHQWNVFSVNSFVQYGIAKYLEDPTTYQGLGSFFQAKRNLLQSALKDTKLIPLSSYGTYFQLYDYSQISQMNDLHFGEYMAKEVGVAVIPISPFCSSVQKDTKIVRLCFAKKDATLRLAAARINNNLGKNLPI